MTRIFSITLILLSFVAFAAAQTKVVPIVDVKIRGLLGGIENGEFLDAKTTAAKLSDSQKYTLYLVDGTSENLLLQKKPTASMEEPCDDFYSLEMELSPAKEKMYEKGGIGLGEGFRWNPQPRKVTPVDLNNAAYKKIVNDFLRSKGITLPVSKLTQAIRVDLDDDGQEEVLLTASRVISRAVYSEKRRASDEYSVVLLRKIVSGKVRTIMLDGTFIPKNRSIYDGYQYQVSSIADLNGDGKMEIIFYGEYYEGSDVQVFEMKGGKPIRVETLGAGCGL